MKISVGLIALALLYIPIDSAFALPSPFTPFTSPSKTSSASMGSLQTITVTDLQNALADSNAQKPPVGSNLSAPTPYSSAVTSGSDTRHGNCWAALIDFDNSYQAQNILPAHPGLALLQQKIFDDQQLIGKPLIPDYVVTNCSLTFADAQMNLAQIAGLLGIKALVLPKIP